ncbi:MAG: hypothetical protein ACLQME_11370 [Alphaproteobacteria bacterium]
MPGARDLVIALLLGAAILLGFDALGGRIELLGRLHLWHAQWHLWVERHFPASAAGIGAAASAQPVATDFRLKRDPFLVFTKEDGLRYHPLIDFAGAQFPGARSSYEKRDFFGFRNDFNAYLNPGSYTYIVMTGNSELVGATHTTTIAQDLEFILNTRSERKYRVLNLGLNSATSSNEINFFVNLAFNLHPEFVISHSFVTDMRDCDKEAPEFQKIGMFFPDFETKWIRLDDAANYDPEGPARFRGPPSEKYLLEGFVRDLQRYRAIAAASGARFIFGLQKFDESRAKGTPGEADWARVKRMYENFKALLREHPLKIDMIDFNSVAEVHLASSTDPMHTTNASARRIAEIYADRILALERQQ